MSEYALITPNMIGYDGAYMKKQSAKYARIENVSDAVHSIRSLYKSNHLAVMEPQTYSEDCQTLKMEQFVRRLMLECRFRTRKFSGH